jgi:hypothetical protein
MRRLSPSTISSITADDGGDFAEEIKLIERELLLLNFRLAVVKKRKELSELHWTVNSDQVDKDGPSSSSYRRDVRSGIQNGDRVLFRIVGAGIVQGVVTKKTARRLRIRPDGVNSTVVRAPHNVTLLPHGNGDGGRDETILDE